MRWKRVVFIIATLVALLAVFILVHPAVRLALRSNRVLYLVNAHRYLEAWHEHDRLRVDFPQSQRLPADFDRQLIERAERFCLQDPGASDADRGAYLALLNEAARRPALAALIRHKRLEWSAWREKGSPATLAAARQILEQDGFDVDALWWVAAAQYDPARPLVLPPELHDPAIRQRLAALPFGSGTDQAPEPAEDVRRIVYLRALAALADADWAGAAEQFERYRMLVAPRMGTGGGDPVDLAHGLALLQSGRPALAVDFFRRYRQAYPQGLSSLAWLVQATVAIPDYPAAAALLDEARTLDPAREPLILRAAWALPESSPESSKDPFLTLIDRLTAPGPLHGDVALWGWLDWLANTPDRRQAVGQAAAILAAGSGLQIAAQGRLMEYAWSVGNWTLVQALGSPAATTATLTAAPVPDPWRAGLARLAAWIPAAGEGSGDMVTTATQGAPLAVLQPDLLISSNQTQSIAWSLPPGATWLIVRLQGFAAQGVWPVVHLAVDGGPERTVYTIDSRTTARAYLLALDRVPERAQPVTVAISLLNAGRGGARERSVRVQDLLAF